MTQAKRPYKGRFAPSPSGELHFGSLVAAMGSYLQAQSQQGQWLVRIEDVDQSRTVPHSADNILSTLERFGFEWDEAVIYQSQRTEQYHFYLQKLIDKKLAYACDCSRNKLRQNNTTGIYPGYCRQKSIPATSAHALRCLTTPESIKFDDQIQGHYSVNLENECGDFIVKRRDGFFAYQLAVVIDDAEQGTTDIIRGTDLLSSTPQQIYLQQQLGFTTPDYGHLPVVMHDNGKKLSKSHQNLPLDCQQPVEILSKALLFLNQSPPKSLAQSSLNDFWQWAIQNWDINRIQATQEIRFNL